MPLINGVLTQSGDLIGEPIRSPVLMSRRTGGVLYDTDHIVQGIEDILTTRVGSRVGLREYGSGVFDLIDHPINKFTVARFYAAIITAINRWERRVRITKVSGLDLTEVAEGHVNMQLDGYYRASRRPLHIERLSLNFYRENTYALDFTTAVPAPPFP